MSTASADMGSSITQIMPSSPAAAPFTWHPGQLSSSLCSALTTHVAHTASNISHRSRLQ